MLKNIFKKSKSRPEKFLGIDIGTSFIRIIEIGWRNNSFNLENYCSFKIPYKEDDITRSYNKENLVLSNNDIAEIINFILQDAKISTKDVGFSIPDFSSFFTTLQLPTMTKEEISQAVKYEIRPYIPLPLSEITLDWIIIEGEVGKTPLKILGVAISNDTIAQYQEIAKLSGLNLKFIEPEAFALTRALSPLVKNQIAALIDIGARSTTCNILENGILKVSHSFNIGSNELTETLAKSLNIEYNEAEELKEGYGLIFDETDIAFVKSIILPLVDAIINESKKAFRIFFQNEGKEVSKIVLAGGLAIMPGLKEYFSKETEKETLIANPFLQISYPSIIENIIEKKGPLYAIATGLALKGFEID